MDIRRRQLDRSARSDLHGERRLLARAGVARALQPVPGSTATRSARSLDRTGLPAARIERLANLVDVLEVDGVLVATAERDHLTVFVALAADVIGRQRE